MTNMILLIILPLRDSPDWRPHSDVTVTLPWCNSSGDILVFIPSLPRTNYLSPSVSNFGGARGINTTNSPDWFYQRVHEPKIRILKMLKIVRLLILSKGRRAKDSGPQNAQNRRVIDSIKGSTSQRFGSSKCTKSQGYWFYQRVHEPKSRVQGKSHIFKTYLPSNLPTT